jgi:competence protein ComEA
MKSIYRFFITAFAITVLSFPGVALAADTESAGAPPQTITVDINSADAEVIAEILKGIGLKKAQDIVAWREKHGKFTSLDQLTEIKGIGEATLAKNADLITIK